ncbi:hypothetical protein BDZ97DRAFT_1755999 [Flammula alnicola]|nr:hypothetical protein BDZ97DRAFT_1755999 [Flammula alnicola]
MPCFDPVLMPLQVSISAGPPGTHPIGTGAIDVADDADAGVNSRAAEERELDGGVVLNLKLVGMWAKKEVVTTLIIQLRARSRYPRGQKGLLLLSSARRGKSRMLSTTSRCKDFVGANFCVDVTLEDGEKPQSSQASGSRLIAHRLQKIRPAIQASDGQPKVRAEDEEDGWKVDWVESEGNFACGGGPADAGCKMDGDRTVWGTKGYTVGSESLGKTRARPYTRQE